jgi:hypothetical protein
MAYLVINIAICVTLLACLFKVRITPQNPFRITMEKIKGLCLVIFTASAYGFFISTESIILSLALGAITASLPYTAYDIYRNIAEEREQRQITILLMVLAKWSTVRNDLIYCLQKADKSSLKKPVCRIIGNAVSRIGKGMDPVKAMDIMESEGYGESFRYVVRNIRNSVIKGGDLMQLFKNLEEQFFRISEELYKRKISTLKDRTAVYLSVFMVFGTGYYFLWGNPRVYDFYFNTAAGKNLLGVFCLMFLLAGMLFLRRKV